MKFIKLTMVIFIVLVFIYILIFTGHRDPESYDWRSRSFECCCRGQLKVVYRKTYQPTGLQSKNSATLNHKHFLCYHFINHVNAFYKFLYTFNT